MKAFLLCLVVITSSIAYDGFQVNDQALLMAASNNPYGVFWRTWSPVSAAAYASPSSLRSTIWAQHLTCPDNHADIEEVLSAPLDFQQLLPPCAEGDSVVRFTIEGTLAFSSTRLDSVEDQLSMPMASEEFFIPFVGETHRHLVFNRDGELVDFLRRGVLAGDAFILRLTVEEGYGVLVNTVPYLVRFFYTTDTEHETDFTGVGDVGVYISSSCPTSGVWVQATYQSVLGGDRWAVVKSWDAYQGEQIMERRLLLPDRFAAVGTLYIGIMPEFLSEHPTAVFQLNEESGDASCICSAVVVVRR